MQSANAMAWPWPSQSSQTSKSRVRPSSGEPQYNFARHRHGWGRRMCFDRSYVDADFWLCINIIDEDLGRPRIYGCNRKVQKSASKERHWFMPTSKRLHVHVALILQRLHKWVRCPKTIHCYIYVFLCLASFTKPWSKSPFGLKPCMLLSASLLYYTILHYAIYFWVSNKAHVSIIHVLVIVVHC